MSTSNSFKGLTAKGVPPQPFLVTILRFVVIGLSVAVLAACAYNLSLFNGYDFLGFTGPPGFMIFITIKTLIILGAVLFMEHYAAHIYFRLAVLVAYFLNIIFWLSGWAWCARTAAVFLKPVCFRFAREQQCIGPDEGSKKYGGSLAAAAALGAVAWVIMIVVTYFFLRACMANPHGTDPSVAATHGTELGHAKHEPVVTSQPYPPGQQPYAPAPGQQPYAPGQQPYSPPQAQPYAPPQGYAPQQQQQPYAPPQQAQYPPQ